MAAWTLQVEEAVERMGDRAFYLEVARFFVDLLPDTRAKLGAALDKGEWPEARRLAHSLKSNCAALGAEPVRLEAYRLEQACAAGQEAEAGQSFAALVPLLEQMAGLLEELFQGNAEASP